MRISIHRCKFDVGEEGVTSSFKVRYSSAFTFSADGVHQNVVVHVVRRGDRTFCTGGARDTGGGGGGEGYRL
jgi:hypothetical protein